MATGDITATIETIADVVGSHTSGTFTQNEVVTQASTGATARVCGENATHLVIWEVAGSPNISNTWTGGTSGAVFTPSATPEPLGCYALVMTEGFTTGATYAFGFSAGNVVGAGTPYVDGVSLGFDSAAASTTTSYRAYVTFVMTRAGTASTADEFTSGGNLYTRMGLSNVVFEKDKAGVGNSGTDPAITAPSAWITNTGGGAQTSAALTAATITNNSRLPYILPRGQWANTRDFEFINGSTFEVAFDPQFPLGGWDGIACTVLTATGVTSSHSQTQTVSTRSRRLHASGLYSDAFRATAIPSAGFTQGETVTINAKVYPKRGDDYFDTADQSSDLKAQCDSNLAWVCNRTAALTKYAVVSAAGNDGTGVASTTLATARASPYLNFGPALVAGATLIYAKNSTHNLSAPGSAVADTGAWYTITEDPIDPGAIINVPTGFVAFGNIGKIRLADITVILEGATSIVYSNATYFSFSGVAFDRDGQTCAANFVDGSAGAFYDDCTGLSVPGFALRLAGGDPVKQCFQGCDFGSDVGLLQGFWSLVACKGSGVRFESTYTAGISAANKQNMLVKNTQLKSVTGECSLGQSVANRDFYIVGNLIESINVGPGPSFSMGQSGSPEYDLDYGVLAHNTFLGERDNYLYNDGPDDGSFNNNPKYRRFWAQVGNIFANREIKGNTFNGGSSGRSAVRMGNFMPFVGCLSEGNWARISDFPPEFLGINSTTAATDPLFTADRSGETSGASQYHYNANSGLGGGTYTLESGSPLLNTIPRLNRHARFDMNGNMISGDATAHPAVGAYQPAGSFTVTVDGQSAAEDATIDLGAQPNGASLPIVVTAAGLVGATVLVSSYAYAGGVTSIIQSTPISITSGGTSASNSAAFSIDDTLSGSISIVSSYGDGDFDINLEWTEESGGGAAAGSRGRGWWRTRNRI